MRDVDVPPVAEVGQLAGEEEADRVGVAPLDLDRVDRPLRLAAPAGLDRHVALPPVSMSRA